MVKFISVSSGEPIYVNPLIVQSVAQRREMLGSKYWWVAGHTTITMAVGAAGDQPTEDVVGNASEVALEISCSMAWVAGGGKHAA